MSMSHGYLHHILKTISTTYQLQPTRPSSQPDAPVQPSVQHAQLILPISPAQSSSDRAQLAQPAQITELSQTIGRATTSTNTNSQRTPKSKVQSKFQSCSEVTIA